MASNLLLCLIALTQWAAPSHGQGVAEMTQLPDNFPTLSQTMNPLYNSRGFQLGRILNVRRLRPILSSFEGDMMVGLGTDPKPMFDRLCLEERRARAERDCQLFENPWPFSFLDRSLATEHAALRNRAAVVFFSNYFWRPAHMLMSTNNQLENIFPVQPNLQLAPRFEIPAWRAIQPEAGYITGRIVRASTESWLIKSFEVIIQEGENANNFRAMSVSDQDLLNYIAQAMLTGRKQKIGFIRLHQPHARLKSAIFNYATQYRIVSVELLDSTQ